MSQRYFITSFARRLRCLVLPIAAGLMLAVICGCGSDDNNSPNLPNFIVCKSTYALCTTALCSPIPGEDKFVSCDCNIETGYSAGLKPCPGPRLISQGETKSRYFPIKSYLRCSNDRPWAMCLDSPCFIDPYDPSHAACKCTVMADQGPYIIVSATGDYSDVSCISGVNSYATVADVNQVTDYLKTHNTPLKPVPIKVFKPE